MRPYIASKWLVKDCNRRTNHTTVFRIILYALLLSFRLTENRRQTSPPLLSHSTWGIVTKNILKWLWSPSFRVKHAAISTSVKTRRTFPGEKVEKHKKVMLLFCSNIWWFNEYHVCHRNTTLSRLMRSIIYTLQMQACIYMQIHILTCVSIMYNRKERKQRATWKFWLFLLGNLAIVKLYVINMQFEKCHAYLGLRSFANIIFKCIWCIQRCTLVFICSLNTLL